MDSTDVALIAELRKNARASISTLAQTLGLTRATIKARLDKLEASGTIIGYGVILKEDVTPQAVRGITLIAVEGRGTERIIRQLSGLTAVESVHTTNGKWDLIVDISTDTLENLDDILKRIRLIEGVQASETNLLLATRKLARRIGV